jgi:hypothetical protein
MSAQGEKIVVDANAIEVQEIGPQPGYLPLKWSARGDKGARQFRSSLAGRR